MSLENLLEYPDFVTVQDVVVAGKFAFGELTLEIDAACIVEACLRLKAGAQYTRLADLTAVDRYPEEPRFEVIYHLHSIERNTRLRLKCRVSGDSPEIDSLTPVWRGADWFEREVFDLFGIGFRNHPDLRRIMLPADYEGHPLRKDYPITGTRV